MALGDCSFCGLPVRDASVTTWSSAETTYVPFIEDLRASSGSHAHPSCFVAQHGLERFLDVLHVHDARQRREVAALVERVDDRRDQR